MTETAERTGLLEPAFLRKLERLSIMAKRVKLGVTKGERKSTRKGSSVDFADYRGYVQGDDLRHVDWNIYSRLNELYIKLFEEREDLTLHLLIDASRSMAFGSPHKLTLAKRLAAALGYIALSGHERVAIEAFSGDGVQRIRPCRGRASVRRLFTFIESIEASGGTVVRLATEKLPALRKVSPRRDRFGRGWIGIAANRAYVVTGVAQTPLLPAFALLILTLGAALFAWYREGR